MKVYLLWWRQSSGDYVIGVFDSEQKAQACIDEADAWDRGCMDIEEEELQ